MPAEIEQLAAGILHDLGLCQGGPGVQHRGPLIRQSLYYVEKGNKKLFLPWLIQNLNDPPVTNALVFSRTKHGADKIARDLVRQGIPAAAIHGNKSQSARGGAGRLQGGQDPVLVATDIAAWALISASWPMCSTMTCRRWRRPMSTASAAPPVPMPRAQQ